MLAETEVVLVGSFVRWASTAQPQLVCMSVAMYQLYQAAGSDAGSGSGLGRAGGARGQLSYASTGRTAPPPPPLFPGFVTRGIQSISADH